MTVCTRWFQFSLQLRLLSSRTFLLECSVREVRVAVATILEKTLDSALLYQEKVSVTPSLMILLVLFLVALAVFADNAVWFVNDKWKALISTVPVALLFLDYCLFLPQEVTCCCNCQNLSSKYYLDQFCPISACLINWYHILFNNLETVFS